eukprot:NODE_312_length_10013_cov_0.697801.p3 type:complete len:538 gc:universal NODE_312_length_10013_cov_0.697801:2530-4143(+)
MLLVTFTAALTDCQNLNQFALGLNMHLTNPIIMNEINTNCCTGVVTGVTCTGGVITRISWRFLGLNGIFTANLPSQLQYIDLEGNSIIGNLPTTGYPPTLNQFKVPYNKFNGTIPSFPDSVDSLYLGNNQFTGFNALPSNLTYLSVISNQISGSFPLNLPNSLQYLELDSNKYDGNITNLPNSLKYLGICGDKFSGILPKLPPSLTGLNACYNNLNGVTYPFPVNLTDINLYYNKINATLEFPPNIHFFVADNNLFHGILPQLPPSFIQLTLNYNRLIGDISNITYYHVQPNSKSNLGILDLSDNQFTGNVPFLPIKLSQLTIYHLKLTGIMPSIPKSLSVLNMNGVKVTGSISLNWPTLLYLDSTLIYNVTIQDTSRLSSCMISNTPMLNNTNVIKLFPFCLHSDLYAFIPPMSNTSTDTRNQSSTTSTIYTTNFIEMTSESPITSQIIPIITRNIVKPTTFSISSESTLNSEISTFMEITSTEIPLYQNKFTPFQITFNLSIVLRLLISMFLLASVIVKTPWGRKKKQTFASSTI